MIRDEHTARANRGILYSAAGILGGFALIACGRLLQQIDDALADLGGDD